MYWCDYCKVWMQDNPAARATHEKGVKHKDNVARSTSASRLLATLAATAQRPALYDTALTVAELRQMRQTAERDVKEQQLAATSMHSIEARAQKQYHEDVKEAEAAQAAASGSWVRLQAPAVDASYGSQRIFSGLLDWHLEASTSSSLSHLQGPFKGECGSVTSLHKITSSFNLRILSSQHWLLPSSSSPDSTVTENPGLEAPLGDLKSSYQCCTDLLCQLAGSG